MMATVASPRDTLWKRDYKQSTLRKTILSSYCKSTPTISHKVAPNIILPFVHYGCWVRLLKEFNLAAI